jgi:hypothetical protein
MVDESVHLVPVGGSLLLLGLLRLNTSNMIRNVVVFSLLVLNTHPFG